ncbi:MAG: hypothetical protein MZW92_18185 [Comamonadaceae bacterium]|nr:hypothetical protein [Comamonadaceae bacterium]
MLCRMLMERLPEQRRDRLPRQPQLSRDDILHRHRRRPRHSSCPRSVRARMLRALQDHLHRALRRGPPGGAAGRRGARHAGSTRSRRSACCPTSNPQRHKLLQIVLFGQPELDEHPGPAAHAPVEGPHHPPLRPGAAGAARTSRDYIDFRMRAAGYRGPDLFGAAARAHHRRRLRAGSRGASTSSPTSRCWRPSPAGRHARGCRRGACRHSRRRDGSSAAVARSCGWSQPAAAVLLAVAVVVIGRRRGIAAGQEPAAPPARPGCRARSIDSRAAPAAAAPATAVTAADTPRRTRQSFPGDGPSETAAASATAAEAEPDEPTSDR